MGEHCRGTEAESDAGATLAKQRLFIIAPSRIYSEPSVDISSPSPFRWTVLFKTHTRDSGCHPRHSAAFLTLFTLGTPSSCCFRQKLFVRIKIDAYWTCSVLNCVVSTSVPQTLTTHLELGQMWLYLASFIVKKQPLHTKIFDK